MDKLLASDQAELDNDSYRLLFEHMLNGMAYCRLLYEQGRVVDWIHLAVNRAYVVQTGMPDVVGRRASELMPGLRQSDPELFALFARVAAGGAPERCELVIHTLDETFELSVYSPRPRHVIAIFDRVSEQRRMVAALAASEEHLRLALEGARLGTWYWDLRSDEAQYSARSARLFGLSHGQALDRPRSFRMIHRDDRALVASAIEYALAQRSDCEFEFRAVWPDGSSHWLGSRGHGSYDSDGQPLHMEGVMWDIDARKRAEQDLRRSEQRFRGLFDCMREGFLILDAVFDAQGQLDDWRMIDVNPAGCAMTAMPRERLIGHTMRDLFPALEAGWYEAGKRAEAGGEAVHHRAYYAAAQRHYDANFYALKPGQIACVFTDVTAHLRAQAEHQRLQAQFMRAQKMDAIVQLTGGIAHDFNNILTGVLGYAKLALANPTLDSKVRNYLREVLSGAERAADLVAKMQIFGRGSRDDESGAARAPSTLIADVLRLLRGALPASIEITQRQDKLAALPVSPTDLHQLLTNLVLNARDAILEQDNAGRVEIVLLAARPVAGNCSDCAQHFDGEYLELAVSDTGPGIAPQHLSMIFDPFFTTKEVGKGTGLGLSVVHGIVHDAGGHIVVAAAPGGGTVMRLLLPR